MPRVETYDGRKVETAALPGARKQASETFESQGGQIGQAQAGFGGVVARVGLNLYSEVKRAEQDRADQVANLTTLRRLNDLDHRILHDPDKGMLQKRGLAVMENRDAALEEFDKEAGAIGEGLKTARQRTFYEAQREQRRDAVRQSIDTHGSRELEKHEAQEAQATLASLHNGAIADPADLPRIARNIQQGEQVIDTHGQRIGLGPEARTAAKAKFRGQVHVGVVDRLLASEQDVAAQEYFEETRDQISDPDQVTRLTKALEEGSIRGQSQRHTEALLSVHTTLEDARAAAKQIDNPKLQDAVIGRLEHEFTVRDRQEREAHEGMVLRGLNIAERTGDWRKIPVSEWQQYTVGERGAIQNYLEQKAAGVTVKTNPHVYTHLSTLALSSDPALRKAFVTANPAEWIDKLSPSDYKHFVDLQGKVRSGDDEAAHKLLVNVAQQTTMVDEALVGMGLDPTPPQPGTKTADPIASERVASFRRAVREAVTRHETRTGKPATDADVQSIVDQLRAPAGRRVVSDSPLWPGATTVQGYAFETAKARVERAADVPGAERRQIEAALRAKGKPITETAIVELFNLRLSITRGDR
jgi:hypothetical protein